MMGWLRKELRSWLGIENAIFSQVVSLNGRISTIEKRFSLTFNEVGKNPPKRILVVFSRDYVSKAQIAAINWDSMNVYAVLLWGEFSQPMAIYSIDNMDEITLDGLKKIVNEQNERTQ